MKCTNCGQENADWATECGRCGTSLAAAQIRARLQRIAKLIENELPPNTGFFLMCFEFNNADARGEYVSNAQWADVSQIMQKLLLRRGVLPLPGSN